MQYLKGDTRLNQTDADKAILAVTKLWLANPFVHAKCFKWFAGEVSYVAVSFFSRIRIKKSEVKLQYPPSFSSHCFIDFEDPARACRGRYFQLHHLDIYRKDVLLFFF